MILQKPNIISLSREELSYIIPYYHTNSTSRWTDSDDIIDRMNVFDRVCFHEYRKWFYKSDLDLDFALNFPLHTFNIFLTNITFL